MSRPQSQFVFDCVGTRAATRLGLNVPQDGWRVVRHKAQLELLSIKVPPARGVALKTHRLQSDLPK
eukprot:7383864-Prymnesium_polylepis.3